MNWYKENLSLRVFNRYLKTLATHFKKTPVDIKSPDLLLRLTYELASSIRALLRTGHVWQSEIFKRVLGETVVLIFVICNLKKESKRAYLALYELQGWYEVLDIFEKLDFDKHKQKKWPGEIKKRIAELKKPVLKEFKSSKNEVVSEKKLKSFLRNKLSRGFYKDAEVISKNKYKDFPIIQKAVGKILKSGGLYQAESNFIHSRYFSTLLMVKKDNKLTTGNKERIIRDTLDRMHLALMVYALKDDSMTLLVDKLTKIMRKIPGVLT